jgi:RimJ/RimL family protein N-acetyltransferase
LVPRPYTREHAESFVRDQAGERLANVIIDARTGEPAGVAGIHKIAGGVATVGYWVAASARRRGAASTALKILPTLAARLGNANLVIATIAETNTASRRTAERAGFELAGTSGEHCPDGDRQMAGLEYRRSV